MLIDCHTHWGICWADRDGHDPSRWLETLDRHDVTHAVVLSHRGLVLESEAARDHDDIAAACARSGGRMIQFASVHTGQGAAAVAEAERMIDKHGARGLKFHPWIQGQSVSQPTMDALAELAAARDVPLYFHDGTPAYSMPSQMAGIARRHPRTKVVLGHCGLLELWREALDALRLPNVWGCLCGPHTEAIRQFLNRADRSRLMWGSDFGFGWADPIDYRLGMFKAMKIDDATWQAIMADNPARLLKLRQSPT